MQKNAYLCMTKASIIGASGYSGAELLRLLAARSDVRVERLLAGTSAGKRVDELYPEFAGRVDLSFESLDAQNFDGTDVAFVCLPSGEAMQVVPQLLHSVGRVIDLSGDFRLPCAQDYENYYPFKHVAPHLLGTAVYGLPELNKLSIATAQLTANPGCYPTGVILALLPALKNDAISPRGIVINSLSGTSGAGRTASFEMSFTEVHDNVRAYKVGNHQHLPEIQSVLGRATGKDISVSFVPHLVPMNRGIYTTIHADIVAELTENDLYEMYIQYYEQAPFVRIRKQIPQVKDVVRTNYCDIGLTLEKRTNRLIVISVIDNLVKGAAGQAVQNMNIMFGLPEQCGLL